LAEILLSNGDICIIDDEDYEDISRFKWHYAKGGYAIRNIWDGKTETNDGELMHRRIMGLKSADGKFVDHANRNGLDNRKENLRLCTKTQNQCNQKPRKRLNGTSSSIYKGVNYSKNRRKSWQCRIAINGRQYSCGYYLTEEEAALAYNEKAKEMHGEFAYLNEVKPKED
jgi:hypothetical protein